MTHNEFREARNAGIPTIAFVDQEVLTFKKVFDSQPAGSVVLTFLAMDSPEKTFAFIREIIDAGTNNAIIPFDKVSKVRELLKRQLASMFGELLSSRDNPIKTEIKDILSEVMTLRHEMSQNQTVDHRFLTVIRFLVDDKNNYYRHFIEHTVGPIDTAVDPLLKAKTFEEFARLARIDMSVMTDDKDPEARVKEAMVGHDMLFASEQVWGVPRAPGERPPIAHYSCLRGNRAVLNRTAVEKLSWHHEQLRLAAGNAPEPNKVPEDTARKLTDSQH